MDVRKLVAAIGILDPGDVGVDNATVSGRCDTVYFYCKIFYRACLCMAFLI